MSTIADYSKQAQLALSAYANLFSGISGDDFRIALQDGGRGMSPTQADRFSRQWRVLDQYDGVVTEQVPTYDDGGNLTGYATVRTSTGLSATVFEEVNGSGKRYLAIRGTTFSDVRDITEDLGILLHGAPSLSSQYQALKGKIVQWRQEETLTGTFTVAGHSLGGWLAAGLLSEFGGSIERAYLYNAPGVSGESEIASLLMQALGIAAWSGDSAKVSNLRAAAGSSLIAGVGLPVSTPIPIEIEAASGLGFDNHSINRLTDSLALYDLFARIDPALNTTDPAIGLGKITDLLKASSNKPALSLEAALDSLRALFKDPASQSLTPTLINDRNAFYTNLYNIDFQNRISAYTGLLSIVPLIGVDALTIEANAFGDIGYRYALKALNPFVVLGEEGVYAPHNLNSELDIYDPVSGNGTLTSQWVEDRAMFLERKSSLNTNDQAFGLTSSADSTWFEDRVWVADQELKQNVYVISSSVLQGAKGIKNPRLLEALLKKNEAQRYIFGTDVADGSITGGGKADFLYGGGGTDRLSGLDGNDYLQGDAGNDTLNGGAGNDTLLAGDGDDYLDGGADDDLLFGQAHNDTLFGGDGNDAWVMCFRGDSRPSWSIETAIRPALSTTLARGKLYSKARRDRAIKVAHLKHGYTLTEIGSHLGLHYTTGSKVINQARQSK